VFELAYGTFLNSNSADFFTDSFEFALHLFLKDYYKIVKDFNMKFMEFSSTKSIFSTLKEFSRTPLIFKELSRPVRTVYIVINDNEFHTYEIV
jgi:hypothetical protein